MYYLNCIAGGQGQPSEQEGVCRTLYRGNDC